MSNQYLSKNKKPNHERSLRMLKDWAEGLEIKQIAFKYNLKYENAYRIIVKYRNKAMKYAEAMPHHDPTLSELINIMTQDLL